MTDEMGQFRVDVLLENPARPGEKRLVRNAFVDTGAMLSWVPKAELESLDIVRTKVWRFEKTDGSVLERWAGTVILSVNDRRTIDEVVFGEAGDSTRLGWRSLSGLNLRLDIVTKQLVDAGPIPAAVAA